MEDGVEQSYWPLSELGFGDKIQSLIAHPSGILPGEQCAIALTCHS